MPNAEAGELRVDLRGSRRTDLASVREGGSRRLAWEDGEDPLFGRIPMSPPGASTTVRAKSPDTERAPPPGLLKDGPLARGAPGALAHVAPGARLRASSNCHVRFI